MNEERDEIIIRLIRKMWFTQFIMYLTQIVMIIVAFYFIAALVLTL